MSWDSDVWAKMVKDSIEMASNQVKRNIEMASEMASNQVKRNIEMASEMARAFSVSSGSLGKETNAAIQKATSEMMASAEKARNEVIASAEKARNEMLKEMMESFERMKMNFSPSNTRTK
jgi:flavorubredoxin